MYENNGLENIDDYIEEIIKDDFFNVEESCRTIHKCKINGVEMSIEEFKNSRGNGLKERYKNKRLGILIHD